MSARRFKPYPAYKDSGVEWLGEIPAHWRTARADSLLAVEKEHVDPSKLVERFRSVVSTSVDVA